MPSNTNAIIMQNWISANVVPENSNVPGKYQVKSPFGCRKINGQPQYHQGVDFGTPLNTRIDLKLSASSTEILFQENGAGLFVTLFDSNDEIYKHTFMHLVKVEVSGDNISIYTGNTGLSYGHHLHYQIEVHKNNFNSVPSERRTSVTEYYTYYYAINPAVFYNFVTGYERENRYVPSRFPNGEGCR